MDKKVLLNTVYQSIGRIIVSGLGVIGTIFLTRYLGTIGFSKYSLILSFVEFAAIFANFGLVTLVIRDLSKQSDEAHFANLLSLRFFGSLLVYLFTIFALPFLPYSPEVKLGILIATPYAIALLLSGIFWAEIQSRLEFRRVVIIQITTALISTAFSILGVFLNFDLLYFVVVQSIAAIVGFALSFLLSRFQKIQLFFQYKTLKQTLRLSAPFAIWTVVGLAYFKIDMILLSFFYSPSTTPDVGLYGVSYRIFEVMIVFSGYLPQTLFPFLSKITDHTQLITQFKKYLVILIAFAIFLMITLYVFAPFAVHIIAGSQFDPSILSLRILSIALAACTISSLFVSGALIHHKERQLVVVGVLALTINIVMNLVFIPKGSFIAASWITVITQIFVMIGNGVVVYKGFKAPK